MRCLGQLLALGFAILFVMLLPCSLWTYDTQRIALDGDTYKNLFVDEDFYEQLIPAVLPSFLDELNQDADTTSAVTLSEAINTIEYDEWEKISPQLVSKEWVTHAVQNNLDAFFTWLEGERSNLDIRFQTGEIKTRLMGAPGDDAVRQIVGHFPLCTTIQQKEQFIDFAQEKPDTEFPYCLPNPPDERLLGVEACSVYDVENGRCLDTVDNPSYRQWLELELTRAKNEAAAALPDELDVVEEMESASEIHHPDTQQAFTRTELNSMRSGIRLWQQLIYLAFLFPAALLSLIVIVNVRSSKTFFRWMGWSLIIGSLFALLPLVFLPLLLTDLSVDTQGGVEQAYVGGALVAEITANGMLRLVVGEFTQPVLEHAAILIGVGFMGVVLSVLLPDPDAPPEPSVVTYSMPVYSTPTPMPLPVPSPSEMGTRLDVNPQSENTLPPTQLE